jgi:hypothetical protein
MKDLKPDSSVLPTWMATVWGQLRQAFLIGAFAAGIVVAALNWWRETFPPAEPATAEQMAGQMTDLRTEMALMAHDVVERSLATYTDSLRQVRKNIEDSVARPVFKAILDLDRRLTRIERGQQATATALDEQRATAEATNRELLDRLSAQSKDDRILNALERFEDRLDEMERKLPAGKTTKQKF